jgi:hypothetical protein
MHRWATGGPGSQACHAGEHLLCAALCTTTAFLRPALLDLSLMNCDRVRYRTNRARECMHMIDKTLAEASQYVKFITL